MSAYNNLLVIIAISLSVPVLADSSYQCFKDEADLLPAKIRFTKSIKGVNGKAYPPCTEDGQTNCAVIGKFATTKKSEIAQKVKVGFSVGGVEGQVEVSENNLAECTSDGQTECVTNDNFKAVSTTELASKLISGQTVAGVQGSVSGQSVDNCSSDGQDSCVTTATYPAADTTGLAAKVVSGNTVAGVAGSATAETHTECTGANQDSCIATSTYKTMDLTNKDAGSAQDINNSNFTTKIKTASKLEYWGQDGTRYTSDGDADISAENIAENANIFGVTGTAGAPPDCDSIGTAGTWILVPGDEDYGTNDFCVMKYEAKNNGSNVPESEAAGTPWVSISQLDAITECASLGKGYHLITNDEWMTIASNIAAQGANWDGGTVGTNEMTMGHSDNSPTSACAADTDDNNAYVQTDCTALSTGTFNQRRTHYLSNGEIIWDLAGNVSEWTSYFNINDKPSDDGTLDSGWRQYSVMGDHSASMPLSDLIPTNAVKSFWSNSWNSTQSIGQYYAGGNGSGGALHRGGGWYNTMYAGVFTVLLGDSPTLSYSNIGFRCAVAVP